MGSESSGHHWSVSCLLRLRSAWPILISVRLILTLTILASTKAARQYWPDKDRYAPARRIVPDFRKSQGFWAALEAPAAADNKPQCGRFAAAGAAIRLSAVCGSGARGRATSKAPMRSVAISRTAT